MSATPPPRPPAPPVGRPTRAALQTLLAWALVAERVHAVAALRLGLATYAAALFGLGLWVAAPEAGVGRAARMLRQGLPRAAAFALLATGWRRLFDGALAPALDAWAWALPWALLALVLAFDLGALARIARLARIELLKLAYARLVRVGLLASLALTALAGLTHERLPNETSWSAAASMLGAGFAVAQVFLLVLGAVSIAGEASQGTLKMLLPHAYRRSDWVLAKGAALATTALVYAAGVCLVALLVARAGGPLGDVTLTAEGFGGEPLVTVHATAATMGEHLRDTALAESLALVATGALGLLLSSLILGVVGALCTAFLAFAALKLGDLVLGLPQETLRRLFPWPPERLREVTTKLGQGLSEGWDAQLPAHALLLSVTTSALCALIACRALAHRDLHL
jgi:hypothetical protein